MKLNQKGQMPRPAVIGIITVVALLIILSLLFFTGTFVGQAIQVSENVPEFQAGVFLDENTMDVGSSATIPVVANLGNAKSTAFGLALKVNGLTYDCDDSQSILSGFVNNQVENTDLITLKNIGCNNDILNAEVAWICSPPEGDDECPNALTGEIEFTEVNVDAPSSQGAASIEFAGFEILSLEDSSNLVTKKGKTIGINEIEEEVELISCNKIGQVGCNADGVGIECYQFYAGGPNYCVPAGCSAAVDAEKIKENPDINVALNSCKGMFGLCEWADGFGVECGFNQGDCTGDYCADGFVCVDSTGDNFDKGIKVCSEDPDPDKDGISGTDDQCPGTLAGASVDANGCVVVATQVSCPSIGDYNGDGVTSGKDIVKFSFHALFGDQVAADPSLSGTCGDIGEQSCLIPIKGKYICDNGLSLGSSRTTCLAGCQLGDYNEDGVTNGKDIVKFSFHALFGDQVSADSTLSNNCGASGEQSCLIPIKNKYICDSGLGLSSTQQQCS